MKPTQGLQFLRPYTYRHLQPRANNPAYARFYLLTRQQYSQCSRAGRDTRVAGYAPARREAAQEEGERGTGGGERSAFVDARIKELTEADALRYPRIENRAQPMRIPIFRDKYRHVSEESPAEDEVVLHGRALYAAVS